MVRARAFRAGLAGSATARQRFTKTDAALPPNPAPDADPGNPSPRVFPEPVKDWKPPATAAPAVTP